METPEKFIWAAELMNIQPDQNIFEIGYGAGLLAEQIISKLNTGHFSGVDRSTPMTIKAQKRNREAIDAGKANFIVSDFKKVALPNASYDAIVAFNVNFFWKNPKSELEIIKNLLKPEGRLFVIYQSPFEIEITAAEPIRKNLIDNGFNVLEIQIQKFKPTSAFCIIAQSRPHQSFFPSF